MKDQPVVRAHLGLLLYAVLISTSFPIASFMGSSYSPLWTTWGRFAIAAAGFMLLMQYHRQLHWPGWANVGRYSLISLPLTGFFLLMFMAGETASSLAMGSLSTLIPLCSCLFAWLFWRQLPQPQRLLALCCGVAGALWVLTGGQLHQLSQGGWPPGNSLFVVACLLMGAYPLVLKSLHRGEPMLTVTGWSLITGCLWLSLALALLQPQWITPTTPQLAAIMWLATATTMLTFFLFQSASLVVGGSSANAYSLLTPALVLVIDLLMGKPLPSLWVLPGVGLIVITLLVLLKLDSD
ncbi:DMT family transporter [Ferrimonas sp. SCSIO 43195]|uniref:DMT family transporter n=1 Tax=Ferrimonas sp. SCSIO 43195 TaxID=2822844 RepID=UPI0020757020|nr:DMT family transporter [Ferrimonas sp. SCSIO 43195]USD37634.1 DMT family transporter [Ferrimonas sp. SCSIO 43195]